MTENQKCCLIPTPAGGAFFTFSWFTVKIFPQYKRFIHRCAVQIINNNALCTKKYGNMTDFVLICTYKRQKNIIFFINTIDFSGDTVYNNIYM